jgi:hypothetical protein
VINERRESVTASPIAEGHGIYESRILYGKMLLRGFCAIGMETDISDINASSNTPKFSALIKHILDLTGLG